MANILLVGCGDIGLATAQHCIANGHHVWAIRRNISTLKSIYRLTPIQADVSQADLPPLTTQFDYILFILSPDSREERSYRSVFLQGVSNVLSMTKLSHSNLKRCFFVSSTGVYGQNMGEWIDEEAIAKPLRFNGEVLLNAEQILLSRIPTTIVRFSGIYSASRLMLIRRSKTEDVFKYHWTNRIHKDDCTGFLSHLVERVEQGQSIDTCYIASDSKPVLEGDVINWLRQEQSLSSIFKHEHTQATMSGKRCLNTKMIASGYELRYPSFKDGYGPIISSLKE